jgi:hypothetical protein
LSQHNFQSLFSATAFWLSAPNTEHPATNLEGHGEHVCHLRGLPLRVRSRRSRLHRRRRCSRAARRSGRARGRGRRLLESAGSWSRRRSLGRRLRLLHRAS